MNYLSLYSVLMEYFWEEEEVLIACEIYTVEIAMIGIMNEKAFEEWKTKIFFFSALFHTERNNYVPEGLRNNTLLRYA